MKLSKKCQCRGVQLCPKTALPVLPYREPQILGSVADLVNNLKGKKITSLLLITDAGIRGAGLTGSLEQLLQAHQIRCTVYDRTVANPLYPVPVLMDQKQLALLYGQVMARPAGAHREEIA